MEAILKMRLRLSPPSRPNRPSLTALGQVVRENLVKGMGNRLDQIVLDTVKTWHFQPATLNGKPVASEAELIFPFTADYPITES
jgi:TonB-like protein